MDSLLFGPLSADEERVLEERRVYMKEQMDAKLRAVQEKPKSNRSIHESRLLYLQNAKLRERIDVLPRFLEEHKCRHVLTELLEYTKDPSLATMVGNVAQSCGAADGVRGGGQWTRQRHSQYPTVDIPATRMPKLHEYLLRQHLEPKLLPWLAKQRGFAPEHLHLVDLFFVKYQVSSPSSPGTRTSDIPAQTGLALHTDGCLLSFNILLNSPVDFEGGGTYFQHLDNTFALQQGGCLAHDSKMLHAGQPITRGIRLLLVGFVDTRGTEWKREQRRREG